MDPPGDRTRVVDKDEEPLEDKAALQTPTKSTAVIPRRGLRERGAGRPQSHVSPSLTDMNGASSSPQSSGRVLRDRSTRALPAWLKDSKSDDDEPNTEIGATKRRKVSYSRRKKNSESMGSAEAGEGSAGDSVQGK